MKTKTTKTIALLKQIAALEFKPFTKTDWDCYAGCETEDPHVAYPNDDVAYVVDGEDIQVIEAETGRFKTYRLTEC